MDMAEWRFPSNDDGEIKGINDSGVTTFKGTPLKSLAREICQNSLDAAIENKVRVEFNIFKITSNMIPGKEVLLDTFIRCKKFWNSQDVQTTKDFFNDAIKVIQEEECTFLRISDFNTCGLTGSKRKTNTNWTNLTKSSGVSDKKGTAGGSFGIGKFAPFASSYFSTVFYSTYDKFEEKAYQGVARLVTFTREDDKDTQGIGYFGNVKNMPVYEELYLDPNFARKKYEYGTDIFIAGYKYDGEHWQNELIISIMDSFLGAIWNEKLEVIVGDTLINKANLEEVIEQYRDVLNKYTIQYFNVLTSNNTIWCTEDFYGLGELKLGLLFGNEDGTNRIAMIRQTGMKIKDQGGLPGHIPFVGILFINGDEINTQLRLIENPQHTDWEVDRAANKRKAEQLLISLKRFIRDRIETYLNKELQDSVDAAGVGNYLPDDGDNEKEEAETEIVSDKVLNIEVKKAPMKSLFQNIPGLNEANDDKEENVHKEPQGVEEEWFHTGGKTNVPNKRPPQEAHFETGGENRIKTKINVGLEKFVCICGDKSYGKYIIKLTPNKNGKAGVIELFLSAETQRYEAPLKSVKVRKGKIVNFIDNKIMGVEFVKGQDILIDLVLDYYDYCSIEVIMYAIT